jgi:hypothetical protein
MIFTKRLREGVKRGRITCSVRIWMQPHVTVGRRYRMDDGEIEVDSVVPMSLEDITPALARASGFKGVIDLLKIASMVVVRMSSSSASTTSPHGAQPLLVDLDPRFADRPGLGGTARETRLEEEWDDDRRLGKSAGCAP